jgi:hypothetical protein
LDDPSRSKQIHEATKASYQAPRIPADELEDAAVERIRDAGNRDEARMIIIQKAIRWANEGRVSHRPAVILDGQRTNS